MLLISPQIVCVWKNGELRSILFSNESSRQYRLSSAREPVGTTQTKMRETKLRWKQKATCASFTREMVVEADPGQQVVEGHVDALQPDWTALEVARLQQFRESITEEKKNQTRQKKGGQTQLLRNETQ